MFKFIIDVITLPSILFLLYYSGLDTAFKWSVYFVVFVQACCTIVLLFGKTNKKVNIKKYEIFSAFLSLSLQSFVMYYCGSIFYVVPIIMFIAAYRFYLLTKG